MNKRPFLIDCDTGTDDAIAIMAALYEPKIDVVALTAVNGNVQLKYTSRNTLDLVDYLGFTDKPVGVGADEAFNMRWNYHGSDRSTHGAKGLGPLSLPTTSRAFYERTACELIYEKAQEFGGELEILAVGPLTNIAVAILNHPDLKALVKHIWIMGGAARGGNVTPTAEFNIWVDPEAARVVFKSGIPLTMVGLDVTTKAILNEEDEAIIRSLNTKAGNFTADLLKFMFERRDAGHEDALMHDALALAAAVCPECLETERYFVDIECTGEYTYGNTYVDFRNRTGKPANADVALKIDLPKFKEWILGCYKNSKN